MIPFSKFHTQLAVIGAVIAAFSTFVVQQRGAAYSKGYAHAEEKVEARWRLANEVAIAAQKKAAKKENDALRDRQARAEKDAAEAREQLDIIKNAYENKRKEAIRDSEDEVFKQCLGVEFPDTWFDGLPVHTGTGNS